MVAKAVRPGERLLLAGLVGRDGDLGELAAERVLGYIGVFKQSGFRFR